MKYDDLLHSLLQISCVIETIIVNLFISITVRLINCVIELIIVDVFISITSKPVWMKALPTRHRPTHR